MKLLAQKTMTVYIIPLIRTLIDSYLSEFETYEYHKRAEPLYNFYEWIYQNVEKEGHLK